MGSPPQLLFMTIFRSPIFRKLEKACSARWIGLKELLCQIDRWIIVGGTQAVGQRGGGSEPHMISSISYMRA